MRRLLAVLVGGAAALVLLIVLSMSWGMFDPPGAHPDIQPAPIHAPDWNETRRYSVNRVLIVQGECPDPGRAVDIAKGIVEPATEAYDEVLVYVTTPGEHAQTRRVQWTRGAGYRVLDY